MNDHTHSNRATFDRLIAKQIEVNREHCQRTGTTFSARRPGQHTKADFIGALMAIDDSTEALHFYLGYVDWLTETYPGHDAVATARANISWCFGEGLRSDAQTMWRVVCDAKHPVFGDTLDSTTDAFQAGVRFAQWKMLEADRRSEERT